MDQKVSGRRAHPVKATTSVVAPEMSAIDAFRAVCLTCLAHLDANREGMLTGTDPEYLHQMRVALRRLRSAFSVFSRLLPRAATEPPLQEIHWLTYSLGPARDWDVFAHASLAPVRAGHPGHRGLMAVQRACLRRRSAARLAAREAVGALRYSQMLADLRDWLDAGTWSSLLPLDAVRALRQPVADYAATALGRRYRQVRRRGRRLGRLNALELHRLRISVKKLRYCVSFFARLFPRQRVAALAAPLEALQDALGGINDCATAARLTNEAAVALRGPGSRQARTMLAAWNATALGVHRSNLKVAWKAFRAARRFWKN